MKKTYLIAIVLVGFLFASCEKDNFADRTKDFFKKNTIISFSSTNIKVKENAKILNVVVNFSALKGKKASADIELDYDGIKKKAVEGQNFKFIGKKKVEFNGKNFTDTIKIEILDNTVFTGKLNFGLKLVNVKGAKIIGIDGGVKTTVTIVDDEHPLAIVLGKYKQVDTSQKNDGTTEEKPAYDVTIEPVDGSIEEIKITNIWNRGGSVIAKVDLDNSTVSILPSQIIFTHKDYGKFRALAVQGDETAPNKPIGGTFDDKGNITLDFWVVSLSKGDAVEESKAGLYGIFPKSVLTKQ